MIGEPVTRIRAGASTGEADRYGHKNLEPDVETPLPGAAFAPAGSTEPIAVGRREVITQDTLYFRRLVDLTADDRVRVRGKVREVDGDPAIWRNPFDGLVRGVVVRLKSTEG